MKMRSCSASPTITTYAYRLSGIDGSTLFHTNEGEMTIANLDVAMT